MNERIRKLRKASLDAVPRISMERARLLTEFHESGAANGEPVPVARALALRHLLEHKELYVGTGELIVGERGPAPKATPTYPEICTHTMRDLEILDTREKISFAVDAETRRTHRELIAPFWSDRSIRKLIFDRMAPEWIAAYESGLFTEFQEQRAPGHTVLDDKIYRLGFDDLMRMIDEASRRIRESGDDDARARLDELRAMRIAAEALVAYACRYAARLRKIAAEESGERRCELEEMAAICERVPARAPRSFHEALQYYWFVHLGVITELNTWDSFNPGRLDRHLWPFYRDGLADGSLTRERAKELLEAFWVKFNNQPAPPKVGVTAQESNTYTDFCLINLGGVDEEGRDAVNDLTFLILDVIEEMRILQPGSMVQISRENPDEYLHRALRIVKTGFGQPSIFNTEAIVAELLRQGKSIVDARNGGASGCVETGAFGKESYILTGYLNLPKILELALHDGVDPRRGVRIGPPTGGVSSFRTFEDLYAAFEEQLRHVVDVKIAGNRAIERLWAERLPAPFMSLLIDDCIERGMDYNDGGPRYNTSYIQGVGLGSITDSLTAIRHVVFDRGRCALDELVAAMDADFDGFEELRLVLRNEAPKYGNDEEYADAQATRVFESFFAAVDGRPNTRGGEFRINLLPTTSHVYFGSVTGATPDGRRSGEPLSEGISPVQGMDRKGPTAVLKSAAKIDHLRTGGTLLNQKFTPSLLEGSGGIEKIGHLVRSYFELNGHHVQFNVVKAETLREAQREPEKHADLIVRVAGYSDYFVDLGRDLQDEIIRRTEHGAGE